MLNSSFRALRTYGKTPEDLDATIGLFKLVLSDYTAEAIMAGMVQWMRTNNQMPTPSDIIAIIDPQDHGPDKTVYLNLSKKPPEMRSPNEWAYMRNYERWAMGA